MDDEFTKLKKLYANPVIRQQFPTMYEFWESTKKKELEEKHNSKVKKAMKTQDAVSGFGVIKDDDISDAFANTTYDDAWKRSMVNRWASLNK